MRLDDVMADLHQQLDSLRPELESVLRAHDRLRISLYVGESAVGSIQTKRVSRVDSAEKTRVLLLQT